MMMTLTLDLQMNVLTDELCEDGRHFLRVTLNVTAAICELMPECQPLLLYQGLLEGEATHVDTLILTHRDYRCCLTFSRVSDFISIFSVNRCCSLTDITCTLRKNYLEALNGAVVRVQEELGEGAGLGGPVPAV